MRWQHPKCLIGGKTRRYSNKAQPIIRIDNATFYRRFPSPQDDGSTNPPIFPTFNFNLPSDPSDQSHWAVIGPSNSGKTTLLEILCGQHICVPSTARSFPHLSAPVIDPQYRSPGRAIKYVGFDGERGGVGKAGARGAYLSARYETRREETDFSVRDHLLGNTELNVSEEQKGKDFTDAGLEQVVSDLNLWPLMNMPMGNLSNGQTRRARIARALLSRPMVLLLDEPFMGLDPPTVNYLSKLLYELAAADAPKLLLSLRPQDSLPDWITHIIRLDEPLSIAYAGKKLLEQPHPLHQSSDAPRKHMSPAGALLLLRYDKRTKNLRVNRDKQMISRWLPLSRDALPMRSDGSKSKVEGRTIVSMNGVEVKYGDEVVLGDWEHKPSPEMKVNDCGLWWKVKRGQRWGIFGSNGTGKTTLISLICSDHPQAYSQPVDIFGRSRLPQVGKPGISIFDIQSRIGQSSPEIHAFFPKRLSIRQTLENAWADTFLGRPQWQDLSDAQLDTIDGRVNAYLRWFEEELNPGFQSTATKHNLPFWLVQPRAVDWANDLPFGQASFSAQRVALFLRAIIKQPDLVVLDEAFSGMDDRVRDKCMLFLTWGQTRSFVDIEHEDRARKGVLQTPRDAILAPEVDHGLSKRQALICVSHVREEVPGVVRHWMRLPEPNSRKAPRFGILDKPLEANEGAWKEIWGL